MSEAFDRLMAEHRRLVILRFLADPKTGGECNDSILTTITNDRGVRSSRDQVKTALNWLEEQGLLTLRLLESGTFVATIRQRGVEVAQGILTVHGVQRPAPGN